MIILIDNNNERDNSIIDSLRPLVGLSVLGNETKQRVMGIEAMTDVRLVLTKEQVSTLKDEGHSMIKSVGGDEYIVRTTSVQQLKSKIK